MAEETPAKDPMTARFIKSHGMLFPKHRDLIQGRLRRLLRLNQYEAKETNAALRVVRPGDRVIELGAGIGYMSTLVALKRQVETVHAFEANPHLIPYIQQVHAANGLENAEVTHGILGPENGEVDFYVRPNILASSLNKLEEEVNPPAIKVPILAHAEVFHRVKPTVLICDIEGAEEDLIPQVDLSGLRAAIVELHPQWSTPDRINRVFHAFMEAGLAYYHRGSMNKVVAFRRDW